MSDIDGSLCSMNSMIRLEMVLRRRELWNSVDERTIVKLLRRNLMEFELKKFGVLARLFEVFDLKLNRHIVPVSAEKF
jgi:hypothetical protein